MIPSKSSLDGHPGIYRALLVALALLPPGCSREDSSAEKAPPAQAAQSGQPTQAPPPAAPQAPPAATPAAPVSPAQPAPPGGAPPVAPSAKPLSELESLVAPIALYPDPLLAELLVASTYPLEVVQAARWLEAKPDPTTVKGKDWDASVMRLVEVPQVVKMMSDHLEWTTQLGDTFLAKPAEVMDAIQALRRRATDSGFLKDTPEQKVSRKTVSVPQAPEPAPEAEGQAVSGSGAAKVTPAVLTKEVVYIEPAQSDTVYVPQYSPEAAYSAPLAPPPATTAGYGAPAAGYAYPAAAPAPSYYPTYYPPATTTTTTSSTDPWLSFGAGALVGGLLTWGIMEWTHDDHYHGGYYGGGYYPVNHFYGNTVCRNGNCWHGGGYGGAYGGRYNNVNVDRGNINRNVNISGNEINVNREGTFNQNQLASLRQNTAWAPDARHRRGQQYPAAAKERLGRIEAPALAGGRLGAAQTLPAGARGFGEGGRRPATLPAERRPSSAEIRDKLAQKPGIQDRPGVKPGQRPATRDIQGQLERGGRDNALEGLRGSGREAKFESRRGAESRKPAQVATREARPHGQGLQQRREQAGGAGLGGGRSEGARQPEARDRAGFQERRAEIPQRAQRPQPVGGQRDRAQRAEAQRRSEFSRPNAFEGVGSGGRSQNYGQRGAASRQNMAAGGRQGFGGGGGAGLGGAQRGGSASFGGGQRGGGFGGVQRGGGAGFGGAQRGGGGGFKGGGGGFRGGGGGGGGGFRGGGGGRRR